MKFRQKLQFLLVLLVGISCGLLLWLSLRKANRLAFELIQEKVYSIAVSTAPRIDGDAVMALQNPDQDGTAEYNALRDKLREVRDANDGGALPVRFIYIVRPLENGEWEYVVDAEEDGDDKSYLGDLVEFEKEEEKPDLHLSRTDEDYATDSFGVWLSAFSPIRDSSGEPVAVVGVDIAAERIKMLLRRLLIGDLVAMVIALILAATLAGWLSRRVTQPLTKLGDFVREIARGNYSSRVRVNSNDEFGELAEAVNQMAEGLEERESLRGALVHYVRSQAADSKLTGGEADDAEESSRTFTALVAELCGFHQLSSRLGSDRVFALLNEYFSTMIDVLLRHGGSLERSSDESVIAVFGTTREDPHQERHAIEAALEMQAALQKLIAEWGIETNVPISLAIGIHTGEGTVRASGTSEQVEHDSVREIVKTASRIAEVGKGKKLALTVSDTTAERLHHTFPLDAVEEDSLDFGLFQVAMPKMNFA